jgi:hypothetical protein
MPEGSGGSTGMDMAKGQAKKTKEAKKPKKEVPKVAAAAAPAKKK